MTVSKIWRGIGVILVVSLLSCSYSSAFVTPSATVRPKFTVTTRYSPSESVSLRALQLEANEDRRFPRMTRWRSKCRQSIKSLWTRRRRHAKARPGILATALFVTSLLFRPRNVLAAMGGGMGGSKGPIAPMARYEHSSYYLLIINILTLTLFYSVL